MSKVIEINTALLPDAENTPFTGVHRPFTRRLQPVSGTVSDRLPSVHPLSLERLQDVCGHQKTGRNTRIHVDKTPLQRYGAYATAVVVGLALLTTLNHGEARAQFFWYSVSISLFLAFDIFDLSSRILAPQSRKLSILLLTLINTAVFANDDTFSSVILLIGVGIAYLIWKKNAFWLDSHEWCMNEAVQKTLNSHPESRAYQAWVEHGRRECKTVARSRGHMIDETITDQLLRDFWMCGYNSGFKATAGAETAKKDAEIFQRAYKEAQARADEAEHDLQTLQARADEDRDTVASQKLYIKRLQQEVEQLKKANEELIQEQEQPTPESEPEQIETEKPTEERIREYLLSGKGVRQTARELGISPAWVSKVKNSGKMELEATA